MTKYEACCKLKEWGFDQDQYWVINADNQIFLNSTGNDGIPMADLDGLIVIAESLAEKRWPGESFVGLGHYPEDGGIYMAEAYRYVAGEVDWDNYVAGGEGDKDPWRAVFNLISKIKEG